MIKTQKLVLYTLPTCHKCRDIKKQLDEGGIAYTECQDIETMQRRGIREVPALAIISPSLKFINEELIKDYMMIRSIVDKLTKKENDKNVQSYQA